MHNLLVLVFIVGTAIICLVQRRKTSRALLISIFGGVILFLYGALRSTSVGTDVYSYANSYALLPHLALRDIFTSITMISRDPFFYSFLKILSHISDNPQFMLAVLSGIVALCISIFIYRNSVNPFLSFVLFICLRYYSFTLSGLRQAVAWSIIMLSYEMLKEKRLVKFVLMVCFASLFHGSAIIFLLAYPLAHIKRIEKTTFIVLLVMLFNFITGHALIRLLVSIPILGQYESYVFGEGNTTSGSTMLLIYFSIILYAFLTRKNTVRGNQQTYVMYNLSLVGIAIITLGFTYPNIFRIGYYFVLPIIVLFPYSLKCSLNNRTQLLVNYAVVFLLLFQFALIGPGSGTQNYNFFWQ